MGNDAIDQVKKKSYWDKRIVLASQIFLVIITAVLFYHFRTVGDSLWEGIFSNCFTAFVATLFFTIIDWKTETETEKAMESLEKETKIRIDEMKEATMTISNSLQKEIADFSTMASSFQKTVDLFGGKSCSFCKNSIKAVKLNRDECNLEAFFAQAQKSICILATNLKSFTTFLPLFSSKIAQGVQLKVATVHPSFARSFNIANLVGRNSPEERWNEMKLSLEKFLLEFDEELTNNNPNIEIKTYCTLNPTLVLIIVDNQCYVSYLLHGHKSRETPHFLFDGTNDDTNNLTPFKRFREHFNGIWNDKGTVITNFESIHNLNYLPTYTPFDYRFKGREFSMSVFSEKIDITLCDMYETLLRIWGLETCTPRMKSDWSIENPTVGQCTITAFLVQDYFGGEVVGIEIDKDHYHLFNVINGCVFDLTSEQFSEKIDYSKNKTKQSRSEHLMEGSEKLLRYEKLKHMFEEQLIRRYRIM